MAGDWDKAPLYLSWSDTCIILVLWELNTTGVDSDQASCGTNNCDVGITLSIISLWSCWVRLWGLGDLFPNTHSPKADFRGVCVSGI